MMAQAFAMLWLALAGPQWVPPGEPAATAAPEPLTLPLCTGALRQGGLVVCRGREGMVFSSSDGRRLTAGADGIVTFGLTPGAADVIQIDFDLPGVGAVSERYPVAQRQDEYRVIEGLDCDKVEARSEEQKAHAALSREMKVKAFATFSDGVGFPTRWLRPSEGPASSPFGPTRKYIGVSATTGEPCEKESTHQGYDIAVPIGTPIVAPADGVVILADPDLYYEGGAIFLDHGHGVVSIFMHMSEIDVAVGDRVAAGERLGASGNTGRTTGPHVHWGVKWRDTSRADRDGDFYIDPALLLAQP